jgi:hypothetical protein
LSPWPRGNPTDASGAFRSGPRAPIEAVTPFFQNSKLIRIFDGFVKSPSAAVRFNPAPLDKILWLRGRCEKIGSFLFHVIPAEAGIQCFQRLNNCLDPGFHRGDGLNLIFSHLRGIEGKILTSMEKSSRIQSNGVSRCRAPCKCAALLSFYAPGIWSFLRNHPKYNRWKSESQFSNQFVNRE